MINFVSHLPCDLRSGGFSALNAAALGALRPTADVRYVGPVNPPTSPWAKVTSKALRTLGMPGTFFHYSDERLRRISASVEALRAPEASADFFLGFSAWVLTPTPRPYVALSDCTFRDYVAIYHRRGSFAARDLRRIEDAEAAWMKRAARVLFTTDWARQRAIADYGLEPARTVSVGIFGETEAPVQDAYAGEELFVFISTNFREKGGPTVLAAFQQVRAKRPGARLVVVGDRPGGRDTFEGVEFCGFLRKEDPDDYSRFKQILGRARALVHPTLSDIAPHVLVEAGYFGCPVIASRRYAIPEIVENGVNGILLDDPRDAAGVAEAMLAMLQDGAAYQRMRRSSWRRTRERHSRAQFEARIASSVADLLTQSERATA